MTSYTQPLNRAQVDVINFWCVVVLVVSAASVAGVVGAAVVGGEFDDRNFSANASENGVEAGVLIETETNGTSRVRWSEQGEAQSLEVRADGDVIDRLNFVGDETFVEEGVFEVYAIYEDQPAKRIDSRG